MNINVGSELQFYCGKCTYATDVQVEFERHYRIHRNEVVHFCRKCGHVLASFQDLITHINTDCTKIKDVILQCGVMSCSYNSTDPFEFINHLKYVHRGISLLPCFRCNKCFTFPVMLIQHMHIGCSDRIELPPIQENVVLKKKQKARPKPVRTVSVGIQVNLIGSPLRKILPRRKALSKTVTKRKILPPAKTTGKRKHTAEMPVNAKKPRLSEHPNSNRKIQSPTIKNAGRPAKKKSLSKQGNALQIQRGKKINLRNHSVKLEDKKIHTATKTVKRNSSLTQKTVQKRKSPRNVKKLKSSARYQGKRKKSIVRK